MVDLNKRQRWFSVLIFALIITFVLGGCGSQGGQQAASPKISIAEQYGIAYAPLQIVKEKKILEQKLPGIQVEWHQLSNTTEIREGMLAGKVDAGFMAIPPFLIGWDKGMDWKIATGLSSSPVGLVTSKEGIKSLKDFTTSDRIALPQPGSVQHILLAMAAERELGDAKKLDNLLVTMNHPDGMNALLAKKDITAHFTAMPYLSKELENKEMHQLLSGQEAMGKDFSFIVGVATKKLHDNNPEVYKAFVEAVAEAVAFVQNNPEQAAEILAADYKLSQEEVLKYLTYEDTEYSTKVRGIPQFADFMVRNGYLTKPIKQSQDVLWEDVNYEN
ncbi:ABC transporter substrate-binding protein [Paradesulfitobacterium aromaticivorans]